jgi:DNA helicase IV
MTNELSEQQQAIITSPPTGNLLIRGETGSGKTTVLVKRGAWLKSKFPDCSLLFVTWNAPLQGYTRGLLSQEGVVGVDVVTFQSWVKGVVAEMQRELKPAATGREAKFYLEKAKERNSRLWGDHRFFSVGEEFWFQEFDWIFGQANRDRQSYLDAERTFLEQGQDRECIWAVFASYLDILEEYKRSDRLNTAEPILDIVEDNSGQLPEQFRYDHVLIDEVQDFEPAWLKALALLPRQSLTLASDLAQRTCDTRYTWEEVGIPLAPGSIRNLEGSYRTTRQIAEVARFLTQDDPLKIHEDYVGPSLPQRDGPSVKKITRPRYDLHALSEAIKYVDRLQLNCPNETCVIAAQCESSAVGIGASLTSLEVPNRVESVDSVAPRPGEVLVTTLEWLRGREFDHVVLVGLEDRTFPGFYLLNDHSERTRNRRNALRRLLYMAMTRARKSCTLSGGVPFTCFLEKVPGHLFKLI